MFVVTQLNSTFAIAAYATVAAALAVTRHQWRRTTTIALSVGGGLLLNVMLKNSFQRARPVFDDPILTLATYSFPSGHVAACTIFYALGASWVFARTPLFRWRVLAVLGASLTIALVAFSRMALGLHYLSDVVAAFAEGVFWLTLCLAAMAVIWRTPGP